MTGEALYDLLSTNTVLLALHGGNVSPITIPQEIDRGICYNTKGLRDTDCRRPTGTKQGLFEIGILATSSVELETMADTVLDTLSYYEGVHLGFDIYLEPSDDDFDETDPDMGAFFKRLYFDLTVTEL